MKLIELLEQIRSEIDYPKDQDWSEQNLYETYALVAELLDASNAYEYKNYGKGIWTYKDASGIDYYIRLAFVPSPQNQGYLELKTYWLDEKGRPMYTDIAQNSSTMDLNKRSDTTAKVFRDEIIPFFQKQTITSELRILPIDKIRHRLSSIMVTRYLPKTYEVLKTDKYISIFKDN